MTHVTGRHTRFLDCPGNWPSGSSLMSVSCLVQWLTLDYRSLPRGVRRTACFEHAGSGGKEPLWFPRALFHVRPSITDFGGRFPRGTQDRDVGRRTAMAPGRQRLPGSNGAGHSPVDRLRPDHAGPVSGACAARRRTPEDRDGGACPAARLSLRVAVARCVACCAVPHTPPMSWGNARTTLRNTTPKLITQSDPPGVRSRTGQRQRSNQCLTPILLKSAST